MANNTQAKTMKWYIETHSRHNWRVKRKRPNMGIIEAMYWPADTEETAIQRLARQVTL